MTPPSDPSTFAFDPIEIDAAAAPQANDNALAIETPITAAPDGEPPGFYLLSDAEGRFVVDREIGVISLKDEALIESERDAVHTVRLRVVEPSGASYEIDMPLRITGQVPQLVCAEAFDFPIDTAVAANAHPAAPPAVPWASFAAVRGIGAPAPISCDAAPYGAVLHAGLPATEVGFIPLILAEAAPPPAPQHAVWAI
ncbi:MAG: hypothetical protein ACREH4_06620 [Vitreimonas sp.]